MQNFILFLFVNILLISCSNVRGEYDIHPDYLVGQKIFSEQSRNQDFFFLTKIPRANLLKTVEFKFKEYFFLPIILNSFLGKPNRPIEGLVLEEMENSRSLIDTKKEILIIHNFQANMKSNFLLEFSNNYMPGGLFTGRYVPWDGSVEIASISKIDFEIFLNSPLSESSESIPSIKEKHNYGDTILLKNGKTMTGIKAVITVNSVIVTDEDGKETSYKKSEVKSIKKK